MSRPAAALVAALGLPAAASAQVITTQSSTVTYSLTWQECDANGLPAGNGNGILDPGESALIRLTVSFSNQNTIGTYSPFPPGPGSGTIRGFGSGFIDLHGTSNAAGTWNVNQAVGLGVDPMWDLLGPAGWGTPANGGADLLNLVMGQFPSHFVVPTNPVADIWRGVWTPDSLNGRTVEFTAAPGTGSGGLVSRVLLTYGFINLAAYCPSNFGSVQIPIAPAPAGLIPLVAPLLAPRRRRRGAAP